DGFLAQTNNKLRYRRHVRDGILRLLVGLIIIAMMIWTDYQTGQRAFSPTIIAAFVLMTFSIMDALLPVSDAIEQVPSYSDSITRIQKIEQQQVQTQKEDGNVKDDANHSTSMSIKNLSYHYPGHSKKAIDQLSLDLLPGNKL